MFERGCWAPGNLAFSNQTNADAIVLSAGALDAVHAVMVSFPREYEVQREACYALFAIARSASPVVASVMRGGRSIDLLCLC